VGQRKGVGEAILLRGWGRKIQLNPRRGLQGMAGKRQKYPRIAKDRWLRKQLGVAAMKF